MKSIQAQKKILLKDQRPTWELQELKKMVLNLDKYKQKFCWKTRQLESYKKWSSIWTSAQRCRMIYFRPLDIFQMAIWLQNNLCNSSSSQPAQLLSIPIIDLPCLKLTHSVKHFWLILSRLYWQDSAVWRCQLSTTCRWWRLSKLSWACNSCRSRRHLIQEVEKA